MLIKSLEIQGFKSFPDKTVMKFGKGITAVVGPNGSGKSNISDAVRWVLGEQSTKSLRGAKMEDVVFSGTALRKAQGFAQVTLVIDNADRRLPFDGDEVSVTRRYYRSGESEYMLNKTAVRLRDINELFMDTGMGRDGYSIISQGKIADIVSAKSEERREIFEEAAGISKFRYRKEEAQRRLTVAEDNLLRLKDILVELEGRVEPLREQAEKAKRFLGYSEEKKTLEIGVWMNSLEHSSKQLRLQDEKIGISSSQHRDIEKKLKRLQTEIEAAFSLYNQKAAELDELRRRIAEREEGAARKEGEISVLENDIFHNTENQQRISQEIRESSDSRQVLEQKLFEKEQKLLQVQKEKNDKLNELQSAFDSQNDLQQKELACQKQIDAINAEISQLSIKLSDAKVMIGTAESSIAEIHLHQEDSNKKLVSLQEEGERLDKEIAEGEKKVSACADKILTLTNASKGYELRISSAEKKAEAQKNQLHDLQMKIQEREQKAKLLEDLEKNMEGFAYSVKLVMKDSGRGLLQGIHGPVSRLISVPEKYSVAIEIGLGSSLQNIVCSKEEDAKRAIAMLKRVDGGRATFLPLTSVHGSELQERDLEECPGFIGLASDLVDCAAQYDQMKKYLLGRIVIAEDLDSAVAIAKRYGYRFRIVTLDGQVINAGGSLTGGSLAKNAGLLNRTNEIQRLKSEAEGINEQYQSMQKDFRVIADGISQNKAAMSGIQGDVSNAQEDKVRAETELRNMKLLKNACMMSINQLEREMKGTEGRTTEWQNSLEQAKEEQALCLEKRGERENALSEATEKQAALSESRQQLTDQIAELRLLVASAEKDISVLQSNIEETKLLQEDRDTRIANLHNQLASLREQQTAYHDKIAQLHSEIDALHAEEQNMQETVKTVTQERFDLEQKSAALRQNERNMSENRETVAKELARLEEQKALLQKEYDDVVRSLWAEYELTPKEAEEKYPPLEDIAGCRSRLAELKNKIKNLGSVNLGAIEEYAEVSERYEFLKKQVEDVEESKAELITLMNDLTEQMKKLFTEQFRLINQSFGETFRELFGGGMATLRLTDGSDVLSSGIEISVQPQGKIITNLEALSGGEKALTAIALYFAIMKISPTPFCVLDEIEAALDDVNVDRFADYLRRMSANTQFIAITHRRGTMEEADMLYGVTMQEKGVSKLLEMAVSEIEQRFGKLQ